MENLTHHIEDEYDNWYPDYPYSWDVKSKKDLSKESTGEIYLSESEEKKSNQE
jgi:hypothetical protein